MWLLGTTTLKLHNFVTDIPDYVILSHTWGAEEVSFDDIKDPQVRRRLNGFDKIVGCCQQARHDGFEWVWIDTCCIDKRSSAELSEAINSMYNWYWQAAKCYAYLSDVPDLRGFKDSTWFERGWTLQELLAPAVVEFFDCEYNFIGTKLGLVDNIVEATGIDKEYVVHRHRIEYASVATIFSWASKRRTTRVEDIAYCLLGLVRVNMPMLYGEGDRAFFRLQLELLKTSNEHTIFAWGAFDDVDIALLDDEMSRNGSVLAHSPAWFRNSAGIRSTGPRSSGGSYNHEVTNNGLRINLPTTWEEDVFSDRPTSVAWLQCQDAHRNTIGIRLNENSLHRSYYRTSAEMLLRDFEKDDYADQLLDMYLQVEDRNWVDTRSPYSGPAALHISSIHTYRGCDVQLISISDSEEVAMASDLVDTSVTSTVDMSYIVNELVVSEQRVACLNILSTRSPQQEILVLIGFRGFEPLIFAVERPEYMPPDVNWYLASYEQPFEPDSHVHDCVTVGDGDFQHVVRAKLVKEGTRLVWSVTIIAAKETDRNDFYGNFGSLKGRHQENNLACFCIDCRVRRLRSSTEKASRWQAKVEIRQEMLASARRQQQKQRHDTGMGHVLECTCSTCAKESFIEVSACVGAPVPCVSAKASVRGPPLGLNLLQGVIVQANNGLSAVVDRSDPLGVSENCVSSSSVELLDTQEPTA